MNAFEEFKNLMSGIKIEPAHIILVATVVLVFVIEIILTKKGILSFKVKKKRMEKAIKLNHTLKATRSSYYDDGITPEERNNSFYHAKYEYMLDGKQRTYKYLSRKFPPEEITLYYKNNPRKPFHYEEKTSVLAVLMYIIPFVIGVAVLKLLGLEII